MDTSTIKKKMRRAGIIILFFLLFQHSASIRAQAEFYRQLADSAVTLTHQFVQYDPTYYRLAYPGGDVPANKGVCTDVIIRAYRKMGVDLQQKVHEDMQAHLSVYPKLWGVRQTDPNIDHRRVPNLQVFFRRRGEELFISQKISDYKPGDLVTWDLGNGIPHIGIVVNRSVPGGKGFLVVHNIGHGQVMEDCLFKYKITGHYRYKP